VRPRKRFGQHFLEAAWVRKVVTLINPQPDQHIVEIGPGRGALTLPLAQRAGKLLVVEIDRDLVAALKARVPGNVEVITGDVLKIDLAETLGAWRGGALGPATATRLVGNLPYNISSPILFRLLDVAARTGGLIDAILMLQREVAERLLADPGGKEYGVLSVLTALHADVTRVLNLPPGAFRPAPKVQSTVVRLQFRPSPVEVVDPVLFTAMVRSAFGQRRKTLANSLAAFGEDQGLPAGEALARSGIDPRRRPETLQLAEFARLAEVFGQNHGRVVL
jgi:16S rRNA (adenine1518-N6/adenine1519-N6)-dimethyltransferase